MQYLSVAEVAKKWNVSERSVRNYCAQGRVPEAFLKGKTWYIPENAEYLSNLPYIPRVGLSLLSPHERVRAPM